MERSTIVRVHEGLHARPATRFVRLAKSFESEVEIVKEGKAVSAKSSVKLMLLSVKENQEVTVRANGADAAEAVEALIGYLENPQRRPRRRRRRRRKPDAGKTAAACFSRSRRRPGKAKAACAALRQAKGQRSVRPSRISRKKSHGSRTRWLRRRSTARSSAFALR